MVKNTLQYSKTNYIHQLFEESFYFATETILFITVKQKDWPWESQQIWQQSGHTRDQRTWWNAPLSMEASRQRLPHLRHYHLQGRYAGKDEGTRITQQLPGIRHQVIKVPGQRYVVVGMWCGHVVGTFSLFQCMKETLKKRPEDMHALSEKKHTLARISSQSPKIWIQIRKAQPWHDGSENRGDHLGVNNPRASQQQHGR